MTLAMALGVAGCRDEAGVDDRAPAAERAAAQAALEAGNHPEAAQRLRRLVDLGEATEREHLTLAGLVGQRCDADELMALLAQAARTEAPRAHRLALAMTASAACPDPAAAARALSAHGGSPSVQALVAALFTRAQAPRQALPHWQRAAEAWPDQVVLWRAIASASAVTGEPEALHDALERVVALAPEDQTARVNLVRSHLRRGDPAAARAAARPPAGASPAEAPAQAGEILLRVGRTEEALAAFSEALAADPTHCPALWGRARAHLESGDGSEAEAWALLARRPPCHLAETTRLLLKRGGQAARARVEAALAAGEVADPAVVRGVLDAAGDE